MNLEQIAFVDTETFGLDPYRHPVWEIAVILHEEDEHLWHVDRTPAELHAADPAALELNGYHDRFGRDVEVLTPAESIARFAELAAGRHIAGAVPSFDEERIRREYVWFYGQPERFPWHYHLIDVETLAVAALAARGHHIDLPWNSDELSRRLGVPPVDGRHTALADARWARNLYEASLHPVVVPADERVVA